MPAWRAFCGAVLGSLGCCSQRAASGINAESTSTSSGPTTACSSTTTIGTLPRVLVGRTSQDAVFKPATRIVYVANQGDDTLSVVDARTCNALDTVGYSRTPRTWQMCNWPA